MMMGNSEKSPFYGVLTLGRDGRVERTSRTGNEYARAEICTETCTYRLEIGLNGDVYLGVIGKRWLAADAAPDTEWDVLYDEDGTDTVEVTE